MGETMNQGDLEDALTEVEDELRPTDTTIYTTNQPFDSYVLKDRSLVEIVELGRELGTDVFYLLESRDSESRLRAVGICFYYQGRPHSRIHRADELKDRGEGLSGGGIALREESDDERRKREQLVAEILKEYREHLAEDELFQLENHPDRMRVEHLIRMRDRLEEEARRDPDEEKRLAKLVYQSEQFGRQFNSTDTEMLLDQLDVEFDSDLIRIDEVHKRAKSLLKVNG